MKKYYKYKNVTSIQPSIFVYLKGSKFLVNEDNKSYSSENMIN